MSAILIIIINNDDGDNKKIRQYKSDCRDDRFDLHACIKTTQGDNRSRGGWPANVSRNPRPLSIDASLPVRHKSPSTPRTSRQSTPFANAHVKADSNIADRKMCIFLFFQIYFPIVSPPIFYISISKINYTFYSNQSK